MASNSRPLTQIENWPQGQKEGGQSEPGVPPANSLDARDIRQGAEESAATVERRRRRKKDKHDIQQSSVFAAVPSQAQSNAATESSSLPIPQTQASVWARYDEIYQVELDSMLSVVERKGPLTELCIVRKTNKRGLDRKVELLNQLRGQSSFVECLEIFSSHSEVHLVYEFMDLTLLHVLGARLFPTEKQVAAIAGQGSCSLKPLRRANHFGRLWKDLNFWRDIG